MFRLTRVGLFLLPFVAAACSVESTDDGESSRQPLGKADAIGSCESDDGLDHCGGKSDGNCWCDDLCEAYGDCCEDKADVCDAPECELNVVCALYCENGFQTDEDGCEICACKPDFCGGFAGFPCPDGLVCVDDPSDTCDPQNGGADCGGICVPPQPDFCGGFAGFPCPDGQVCVDDPSDDCDPQNGGADCGGICVPEPPPGPSCEGNCGGSAGGCYCDDLCEAYGDCCDDYAEQCTAPEPVECGDDVCAAGEVCITHVTQVGPIYSCAEVPASCTDGEATCDCMSEDVCTGVFNLCNPTENGLSCSCPVC